jgi:hypothetical protein
MVDVCVLGPSKSFLQEALVRDLDPRAQQGGDDVVFDFSKRVRTPPRRMTSRTLRGGGSLLEREQCGWEASPFQSRVFWRKISCTTASTWCSILGTACPSTGRLAASTGCGSPSILPRGRYGGN